jgi:hypothetical protein
MQGVGTSADRRVTGLHTCMDSPSSYRRRPLLWSRTPARTRGRRHPSRNWSDASKAGLVGGAGREKKQCPTSSAAEDLREQLVREAFHGKGGAVLLRRMWFRDLGDRSARGT